MWGQTTAVPKQPTVWDIIARLAQEAEQQRQALAGARSLRTGRAADRRASPHGDAKPSDV